MKAVKFKLKTGNSSYMLTSTATGMTYRFNNGIAEVMDLRDVEYFRGRYDICTEEGKEIPGENAPRSYVKMPPSAKTMIAQQVEAEQKIKKEIAAKKAAEVKPEPKKVEEKVIEPKAEPKPQPKPIVPPVSKKTKKQ